MKTGSYIVLNGKLLAAVIIAAFLTCACESITSEAHKVAGDLTGEVSRLAAEKTPAAKPPPPEDLKEMIHIPAGEFIMGCDKKNDSLCLKYDEPMRKETIGEFWIDKTVVTVEQWLECYKAGKCAEAHGGGKCNGSNPKRLNHPANCMTWRHAKAYCEWKGKRLPNPKEWEKAARGVDGRNYPWGNDEPNCGLAVMYDSGPGCGLGRTWPVCSKPKGNSPYGLCDMSGSISEWLDDGSGNENLQSVRGGGWAAGRGHIRIASIKLDNTGRWRAFYGFRCAY